MEYPSNGIGDNAKHIDENQAETDAIILDQEERLILLEVGE